MPARSKRFDLIPPYLFAEISRIKAGAIRSGADIIDLGIGDPDQPTPLAIVDALTKASHNPATHRYDESPNGWVPYLEAAVDFYEDRFGVRLDPAQNLLQLIGSKEGLAHLAWSYIDPGDVAIVPNPGYTVYKVNALMAGGEVYETPLREMNRYLPILEDIPTDVAKRAKLFYVCYPHNPTGAVATKAFYEDLLQFCRAYDILAVNDMAYATVTYDGFQHPTLLQVPGSLDHALEFHSLSKMFNMTGWRLGFAAGNADAIATLSRLKSNLDSKQFPAIAQAGADALRNVNMAETMAIYHHRRNKFVEGLRSLGWQVEPPKASFYIWAKVPVPGMTSAEFCGELLKRAHIVAIPGNGYGTEGEGYVRFSLTILGDKDGERLQEAVNRIAKSGLLPAAASVS